MLDAATRLFWERGYEATSIGDLTRAMGIKPGSLYAAFGDKKALFKEAVQAYGASPVGAFMAAALDEEPTACGAMARILREAAANYCDPVHPTGCLTISAATNVTEADDEIAAYLRDLRNANLRLLHRPLHGSPARRRTLEGRRTRRIGCLLRSRDPGHVATRPRRCHGSRTANDSSPGPRGVAGVSATRLAPFRCAVVRRPTPAAPRAPQRPRGSA
ncbi:TetR/AcrR family transcriptional regulator [Yinghuangia aomiensis]